MEVKEMKTVSNLKSLVKHPPNISYDLLDLLEVRIIKSLILLVHLVETPFIVLKAQLDNEERIKIEARQVKCSNANF